MYPSRVYGILYLLLMTVSAWAIFMWLLTPLALICLVVPSMFPRAPTKAFRKCYHAVARRISTVWFYFACGLFEMATSIKLRVNIDPSCREGERSIVICNHHSHLDWYPLLCMLCRLQQVGQTRILLKDSLKRAPIFGWGFQCFLYIFLARRRDQDLGWIHNVLNYLNAYGEPSSLLIFPEGTDFCQETVEKSNEFAKAKGLRCFKHVLHPRTKGLHAIMEHSHDFDAIYDCTLAFQYFTENEVPAEQSILNARYPPVISINIERFDIKDIPKDPNGLQQWCSNRFTCKDDLLESCGGSSHLPLIGWANPANMRDVSQEDVWIRYIWGLGIAFVLDLLSFHLLWTNQMFRNYSIIATIIWLSVCQFDDGFDRWLVRSGTCTL